VSSRQDAAPDTLWDANFYDRSFGFVSAFGADMVDLLDPKPGEHIVDLGCGTGQLTAEIAARGTDVLGLDGDPAMVERASAQHPTLPFRQADGHDFQVDRPADAVFSNAALHWMKEPERVIACVARALKPGGRFVAEMGAHRNVKIITDALYQALGEEGVSAHDVVFPWYFPRTGDYVCLLEAAGLDVSYLRYFARPTPLDDCPNGLADWVHMFGQNFIDAAPADRVQAVIERAVALTRDRLCPDGRWVTDYTRLRFVAVRFDAP
jgi:trans-aconitate methyltransferase